MTQYFLMASTTTPRISVWINVVVKEVFVLDFVVLVDTAVKEDIVTDLENVRNKYYILLTTFIIPASRC